MFIESRANWSGRGRARWKNVAFSYAHLKKTNVHSFGTCKQCCGSGSVLFWVVGPGSSSKWKTRSGSATKWNAGSGSATKWKGRSLTGSFWSIGGSKYGKKWVAGSGAESRSASNWNVGSGSGSASEWKVGSADPHESENQDSDLHQSDPQHCLQDFPETDHQLFGRFYHRDFVRAVSWSFPALIPPFIAGHAFQIEKNFFF